MDSCRPNAMQRGYTQCVVCFEWKTHTEFFKDNSRHGGLKARCKVCDQARITEWRQINPEGLKNHRLMTRYNLTPEQWEDMFNRQGRCCAICKSPDPKSIKGWHTDHIEKDGQIIFRGVLCQVCNPQLGMYEKNIRPRLSIVEAYLKGDTDAIE